MDSAVLELLKDPALPGKVAMFQQTLEAERERRARFYEEITPELKAEFINGEVIMHSPALNRHIQASKNVLKLLDTFAELHGLGVVRIEKALCAFPRNDYEPDVVFFGVEKAATLTPETLQFPVPDFVCEVLSDSTEHRDRGVKYLDFEAHGVGEYWIVDADHQTLEQYLLRNGEYALALKSGSGDVESAIVRGFRIPIRAIFDDAENLRVLRALFA